MADLNKKKGDMAKKMVSNPLYNGKNKKMISEREHGRLTGEQPSKMPKAKCETCGGAHKNHASYTYKTGNI